MTATFTSRGKASVTIIDLNLFREFGRGAGTVRVGGESVMHLGPEDHAKFVARLGDANRLAEDWRHFRIALELFVSAAIDWLDDVDRRDGHEPDGDESEDEEGQYSIPGMTFLIGANEDDEPTDN